MPNTWKAEHGAPVALVIGASSCGSVSAVRVIDRGGEPWFVLADVCTALGISNPSDAARRLDDDEKATLDNIEGGKINGLGAFGAMPTITNESGLYSTVLTSRKPSAKRFKKWMTAEVLPSIRKTGAYAVAGAAPAINVRDPGQLAAIALQLVEVNRELTDRVAVLEPKAVAHDRLATSDGAAGAIGRAGVRRHAQRKPPD